MRTCSRITPATGLCDDRSVNITSVYGYVWSPALVHCLYVSSKIEPSLRQIHPRFAIASIEGAIRFFSTAHCKDSAFLGVDQRAASTHSATSLNCKFFLEATTCQFSRLGHGFAAERSILRIVCRLKLNCAANLLPITGSHRKSVSEAVEVR
jgi:hypothetical protein